MEKEVIEIEEIAETEKEIYEEKDIQEVLKMFAPGTSLRTALDDFLRARMGALIVFENDKTQDIIEKGFWVNCKFSAQKLVELAKMDGAIILSNDAKKILYANTLLAPSLGVSTKETGTRHKAAERTAKQTGTIVVAVSERKNKITLYYKDMKHIMDESSEILRRASETLQVLEKQREMFNDLIFNLNILEINNLVTIDDVSGVFQRIEIIKRISEIVKRYLIELGKEGMIVSMRLKELTRNLNKDEEIILRDYFGSDSRKMLDMLEKMNFDFLLESNNISRMLFEELHDKPISPRGIRILSKTNLLERYIDYFVVNFGTLDKVLSIDEDELSKIFESEDLAKHFLQELDVLKEKIMLGKKI